IELCNQLIANNIDNLAIRYNLNWAEYCLGNYERVVANIKQIGNAKQEYLPFLILEARTLHHLGKVEEATFLTRHTLEIQPQMVEAQGLLSMLLLDSEHYSEARELAAAALRVNSANHESLITLTTLALNEQDAELAKSYLSNNPKITLKSGRLLLNLGQAQMLDMEFDQAEQTLTQASEVMGQHIGTWHALAWVKLVLNKIDEAGECFQRAYDLDRNFAESHGGLAVIAIHQNRIEEAEKLTKTSLRLDPLCASGRYAESLLVERRGNHEEATSKLEHLIKSSKTPQGLPILDVVERVTKKLRNKADDTEK
ncbi:MAG: tetratricopeptide repeat protein, partial [Kangiellaceae bacterium]|nr:tetratricopeptide repeat protein [Kangiellaceae bacterium]